MKNLYIWICILCPLIINGQSSANNFLIQENKVIWQKIYIASLDFEQLVKAFKLKGCLEDMDTIGTSIIGKLLPFEEETQKVGIDRGTVPIYVLNSTVSGFVVIEFNPDGRYRVTFKNIFVTSSTYGADFSQDRDLESLDTYAISPKGIFRNLFIKKTSLIYDYSLTNIFSLSNDNLPKDDW